MTRIELPEGIEEYGTVLQTGDLLFIKNRAGEISHVVLWVGPIGKSPDNLPLVLDSTGEGSTDSNGEAIPSGIHLRPFRPGFWYANSASHALRILPRDGTLRHSVTESPRKRVLILRGIGHLRRA